MFPYILPQKPSFLVQFNNDEMSKTDFIQHGYVVILVTFVSFLFFNNQSLFDKSFEYLNWQICVLSI